MKWTKKGHEADQLADTLAFTQNAHHKYYIFGAGYYGRELLHILKEYGFVTVFIDNDKEKQNSTIEGTEVISLDRYLDEKDGVIVIAVAASKSMEIVKQLEDKSLKHGIHFWFNEEFQNCILPVIFAYFYNKAYVPLAQITLTERCSLRCRKCAHGCFAVDNRVAKDLTLQQVYKSADSFFSKVDYIYEFVLIGGEPLLYKELEQAICYIGERYRRQIGIYSITTNGTLVPSEVVLAACKKYDVLFRISNYSKQLPRLRDAYQRLTTVLEKNDIAYILESEDSLWMDYGFDYLDRQAGEEELIKVFDACRTPCREIRENRFYYCVMARSVSDNLGYNVGENDYLDLDKLDGENYKRELLEFTLGYSDKGYLDMCNHCHGRDAHNYPIPVAEQV